MNKINISVSVSLDLGPRLIQVGDKLLGTCDGVTINIAEATPEELIELKNAQVIKLVKSSKEVKDEPNR
jgi:hypothetical protein